MRRRLNFLNIRAILAVAIAVVIAPIVPVGRAAAAQGGDAATPARVDAAIARLFTTYYRLCGVAGDRGAQAAVTAFEGRIARTRWAARYAAAKARAVAEARQLVAECMPPDRPDIIAQREADRREVAAAIADLDRLIAA